MEIETRRYRILKIKEDCCYLAVRMFCDGLMLCAVTLPLKVPQVDVVRNNRNQLAFKFERADGFYYPKVVGTDLKLEKIKSPELLTESHWFERYNLHSGNYYGLCSVVEPRKYLCIKKGRERKVGVSWTNQDCFQITDLEKIKSPELLTESHWFERYNLQSGNHYGLCSVVEPRKYLCIKKGRERKVGVSWTNQDCFQITGV